MPALCSEVGIQCLASVLGQLKHHRPAGFLLANGGAGNGMALRCDVGDAEADQVAATQLAVNAEVEQCQVADATMSEVSTGSSGAL